MTRSMRRHPRSEPASRTVPSAAPEPAREDPGPVDPHALADGAGALGLTLDRVQLEQLQRYAALLLRWNRVHNLTALDTPAALLTHHLLDCLAILPVLDRWLGSRPAARVLDVGSGGGLPGVVLAIARPGWSVTTVDAVEKKAAFVRQAQLELRLANLHAEHARVEALRAAPFDAIVSRAFAALADFVALTGGLRAADGFWVAMKGGVPHEEIAALPAGVGVAAIEPIVVPGLAAQRHLLRLEPRR